MVIPLDVDYRKATNAAYEELDRYTGGYPVIDVYQILRSDPRIRLCTYSAFARRLRCDFKEFVYGMAPSEFGFTIIDKENGNSIVFYNDHKSETTNRFTFAHELGHIRLGHTRDDRASNKEANCYARNLLCPIPVVQEGKLKTIQDYASTFYVSDYMAYIAMRHFNSDLFYVQKEMLERIRDKSYCSITGFSLSELYGY